MKWGLTAVVMTAVGCSRRWKLRWQPHATHANDVGEDMNSPQPSKAWPPMPAAWFLRHSLYVTAVCGGGGWWCVSVFPFASLIG